MSFTPDTSKWAASTVYNVNDTTKYGKNMYTCLVFHTASVFESDLASGYWQLVNEPALGKNYLAAASFEDNDTGMFSLFNTTLTSKIPTGAITAGAASITTFNTTSSGALAGGYSLQTSIGSGTITAGHGFISNNMTVAPEDKAKVMQVSFSYSATTGSSLMNFSGTSSNTWAVYIYDNANSAWIQPAGVYNMVQGSGVGKCTATFQTPSNATTVRVAVICINANTSGAVAMLWDSFYFGPQSVSYGAAMSDMTIFTPTVTSASGSITNLTKAAAWRRNGQYLEMEVTCNFTGAAGTWTGLLISLPPGLTVDTNVLGAGNTSVLSEKQVGYGTATDVGVQQYDGMVVYYSTTQVSFLLYDASAAIARPSTPTQAAPFAWGNTDVFNIRFSVPIAGWSSNTVQSADTDTRVVAFSVGQSTTGSSITGTLSTVAFSSTNIFVDTHGAYVPASARYYIPVSGIYKVRFPALASVSSFTTQGRIDTTIYKNGSQIAGSSSRIQTGGFYPLVSPEFEGYLNAGDYLECKTQITEGTFTVATHPDPNYTKFIVERLSGPATIAANETVGALYAPNSATGTLASGWNAISFSANKVKDSHSAYSGNTYTIPVSGQYDISAFISVNATYAVGNILGIGISIDGATNPNYGRAPRLPGAMTNISGVNIDVKSVPLRAGQTVTILGFCNATTPTFENATGAHAFSIVRSGNY